MSCGDKNTKHSGHFCKRGNREQFQAVIIPSADFSYTSPVNNPEPSPLLSRNAKADCDDGRSCSWWWITVHPRSITRTGAANGAPPPQYIPELFAPLSDADIQARGQACSSLKIKLTLSDQTDKQRTLIVDAGAGFSLAWYGTAVQIEVLTFNVRSEPLFPIAKIIPSFDGFMAQVVEDVVIEANCVAVDASPPGLCLPLTCTQVISQVTVAGVPLEFPRAAGARRVAYYSTSGTPTSIDFAIVPGALASFIAQLDPSPMQANSTVGQGVDIPGPACALVFLNAGTGTYTTVWEIQP